MSYSTNLQVVNSIANGAVAAFSIVTQDPSNDSKVVQSTANRPPKGIGPSYAVADGVGCPVAINGVAQVKLGTISGTLAAGSFIKSDASGLGVALATGGTTPQHAIGFVLKSGVTGDIVPVQIQIQSFTPGNDYLS